MNKKQIKKKVVKPNINNDKINAVIEGYLDLMIQIENAFNEPTIHKDPTPHCKENCNCHGRFVMSDRMMY